jgi:hypothetical protein
VITELTPIDSPSLGDRFVSETVVIDGGAFDTNEDADNTVLPYSSPS